MKDGDVGERIRDANASVPQRGRECTVIGKNSVTLFLYRKDGLSSMGYDFISGVI
jgi:hypothetical protein